MKFHELKSWPEHFEAVWDGTKRAEWRRNDRGYERGDVLILREWEPKRDHDAGETHGVTVETEGGPRVEAAGEYLGRWILAGVTSVLIGDDEVGEAIEIPSGFAVLSVEVLRHDDSLVDGASRPARTPGVWEVSEHRRLAHELSDRPD